MPCLCEKDTDKVYQLSVSIERYLRENSQGADTLKGIVHWWLMQQRLYDAERDVKAALEYLCLQQVIEKRILADGTELYLKGSNVTQLSTHGVDIRR